VRGISDNDLIACRRRGGGGDADLSVSIHNFETEDNQWHVQTFE
jgi:hypothetical protein